MRLRMLCIIGLFTVLGCSEHKVEVSNSSPEAVITSPTDGSNLITGEGTFTGSISDPDDPTERLMGSWWLNDEIICDEATPTDFGRTSCTVTLDEGTAEIRLQARDPKDAVGIDVVTITVGEEDPPSDPPDNPPNHAPTCSILEPISDTLLSAIDELLLRGTATDVDQEAHTLDAVWESDSVGIIGATHPSTDGSVEWVADPFPAGLHVIKLTVTDTEGATCVDSTSVRVGNDPQITITSPAEGAVVEQGLIAFTGMATDADDPPGSLIVQWDISGVGVVDSSVPGDSEGLTFAEAVLDVGVYTVSATVTDTHGQTASDDVTFTVNDVPGVADVEILPDPAWADDSLMCSWRFIDSGAVDVSVATWSINGAAAGEGATLASGYVHGDTVSCSVMPDDGVWTGDTVIDSITISNTPPSVDSVTIMPPEPTGTDALACSYLGFLDIDDEPDESSIEWRINGVVAGVGETLTGGFERGDIVSCTVIPSDGTDVGEPVSATVTIGNTPPQVTAVILAPDPVYTNTELSALSTVTDSEGDPVSLTYAWTVDGVLQPETGHRLSGVTYFDKNQVVAVTVTPHDGFEVGVALSSDSVRVLNTPPVPPSLIFVPDAPVEGEDDIWCAIDEPAFDADGDAVELTFEWTLDDVAWASPLLSTVESDDTVPLTETEAEQAWTCTVTPDDGDDTGTIVSRTVLVDSAETRVFVTYEATSSDMGGPSGGDAFCTEQAELGGLGGTWVAYLSGGGASAISRIPEGPYVRLDGALIAESKTDLTDGSIMNPIWINPTGSTTSTWVCTGSSEAGFATGPSTASGGNCQGWTRGCGVCDGDHWYAEVGRSDRTNDDWSTAGWNFCGSCYLYCFEQ